MRNLFSLPRFDDRSGFIYVERAVISVRNGALQYHDDGGKTVVPIAQFNLIMLGPGTSISQEAVKLITQQSTMLAWVGEDGVRCYAHSTGGTFSNKRILHQARMFADPELRRQVARRMYLKRFGEIPDNLSIDQMKGMEGSRVRKLYKTLSEQHGIEWTGRNYDQSSWGKANPVNRAISVCNSCLYGICHAAIVAAGYSAAIGFIHSDYILSFVLDIADLYKSDVTLPLAFQVAARSEEEIEGRCRHLCRDHFTKSGILKRIIPDIHEVLDATDTVKAELSSELQRTAVSIAS